MHWRIGLMLLLVVGILAGCRTEPEATTANIDIQLEDTADMVQMGSTTLQVTLADADGNPINDATLNIRGDMNHAGMAPVLREVSNGDNGVYDVPYEWTMAGDWFVEVTVTLADGGTAQERFDFMVEGDMGDMEMTEEAHNMDDMDMTTTEEADSDQ